MNEAIILKNFAFWLKTINVDTHNCVTFLTGLLLTRDIPTINGVRIQLVFARGNERYHLYAPSAEGELLAMVRFLTFFF